MCTFGKPGLGQLATFIILQLPMDPQRCEEDTLMDKLDLLKNKQEKKNLFTSASLVTGLPRVTLMTAQMSRATAWTPPP